MTDEAKKNEVEEMLAKGYVPAVFDKMDVLKIDRGAFLVFQFSNRITMEKMAALTRNFQQYLIRQGIRGIFLPHDVSFVGALQAPVGGELLENTPKLESVPN